MKIYLFIFLFFISKISYPQSINVLSYEVLSEKADSLYNSCNFEGAISEYRKFNIYSSDTLSNSYMKIALCQAALNYSKDSVFKYLFAIFPVSCKVSMFDFYDFIFDPYKKFSEWEIVNQKFIECNFPGKSQILRNYCLMFVSDQKFRNFSDCRFSKFNKEEIDSLWYLQKKIDSLNSSYIYEISLNKKSKIPSSITEKCAYVAFIMVLLHSPLHVLKAYKKAMNKAFKQGNISKLDFAFFHDKLKVAEGKKQIYGTQHIYNEQTKQMELAPIKNIKKLKKRLSKIGIQN
jgi:hypothetical protein